VRIYTIGHSNHTWDTFASLLKVQQIEVLVDVRSKPVSRGARSANKRTLPALCEAEGLRYAFIGDSLGGKPGDPFAYDASGNPDYAKIAARPIFGDGIQELVSLAEEATTAIMCAEEDPSNCHRSLLIGPALEPLGVEMRHIRRDDSV
jgi:uncharacterized protein (DUF488 family)